MQTGGSTWWHRAAALSISTITSAAPPTIRYRFTELPRLANLQGHDVHGTRQLWVIDTWFLDEGTIRGWRLVTNLAH